MLEEIVDTLDQLGVEKLIFFGEATSGEVGHAFPAKYPSRILALITCSSPTMLPPAAVKMLEFRRIFVARGGHQARVSWME